MRKRTNRTPHTKEAGSTALGRRTLLRYTLGGGAALAATVFGAELTSAQTNQGSSPALPRPPMSARVRRVVTAHNAEGKSYVAVDELVDVSSIWATTAEQPLGAPAQGEKRMITRATGETRCFVAAIQPSRDPKPDLTNRVGFHRTPGIAYCFVLNGQLVFLTDMQEVRLKAGDVVVERNTMHSWRNETSEPVSMLITTVNGA